MEVSYEKVQVKPIKRFKFFVDECEIKRQGKDFLALSFVQTENWDEISATTYATLRKHIADPFSDGQKDALKKRGLHYSDSTQDLRKSYVDQLVTFPFKSYLVYGELSSPEPYASLYMSLIKEIRPHRLMGCNHAIIELIFEENSKIKQSDVKNTVDEIYKALEKTNNRRPDYLEVTVGKKLEYPCFSVPDFMLGVFSNYATFTDSERGNRNQLFFEKLRDKYRIILDTDKNIIFSRKRPFQPWQ